MKATSTANHGSVISLLDQGYSVRDIEKRTGLGESTVGRIKKEMDTDKENNCGGCPSKLSTWDKAATICQIQSGMLDTTVQATNFINSTIPDPVHPQTVRRALKESGFHSTTKKKVPMLKKTHCQKRLEFAWKLDCRGLEKSLVIRWNKDKQDGKLYVWKHKGKSDCTTTPTVKHGGGNNLMVWECMGWNDVGMLIEVEGKMDDIQYCEILDEGMVESFEKLDMEKDTTRQWPQAHLSEGKTIVWR